MKKTKAELEALIASVTTPKKHVIRERETDPEEDAYIDRLREEFGYEILFKAQKLVRGWGKMTAKQQYEFLLDKKSAES